ncbi:PIN-like domain-containing protein [Fibrella forsythiae]|uniref:DUF4935 domain-containing protein n=1 Tax=Fibrella forsythiae TaxID=2817061 RepID=A0ABS3JB74_9BACT|nr:PIN-like domain-containing protein [Fibrella forsythiae]MBO0947235.1 DUF4935 domain-containing protein [Fibrella forsythiae]
MPSEIGKYSFGQKLKELDLVSYIDSLRDYKEKLPGAIKLESGIPIFIDTNVLLRYYETSFFKRRSLFDFFETNKESIILTNQVQKEFVKNRENVIEGFFNETLKSLGKSYKESIANSIQQYYNKNKKLFDDLPKFDKKIQKLQDDADKLQDTLEKEINSLNDKIDSAKNNDRLLSLTREMQLLDPLPESDITFLKTEFDNLKKNIDPNNIKNEATRPQVAFPGLGDITKKPKNPYGDYLLFHEMVLCIRANDKDAIFLTYDSTKNDWLKEDKEPHSHYVQIVFLATGHNLFIIDAERFFDSYLKEHFNSLIVKKEYYSQQSNEEVDFIYEFIGFERYARSIGEFIGMDNFGTVPLIILIGAFIERGFLSQQFMIEYKTLAHFRNLFLHSNDRVMIDSMSHEHILELLERLRAAVDMLEHIYKNI